MRASRDRKRRPRILQLPRGVLTIIEYPRPTPEEERRAREREQKRLRDPEYRRFLQAVRGARGRERP